MKYIYRMIRAIKKYRTAQAVWGYFVFSLIFSLFWLYTNRHFHGLYLYTVPLMIAAIVMGYLSGKDYLRARNLLIDFYRDEGTKIEEFVADIVKPYRRGALYLPEMIPDIVDGKDVYRVYTPFIASRKIPLKVYYEMLKRVPVGQRIFWMTLLDMMRLALVDVEILEEEEDMILKVKRCNSVPTPVIEEICDVLKKASVREKQLIEYDSEQYIGALTLKTLEDYLNEVEAELNVDGNLYFLTRMQHVSIILYEVVLSEFKPPNPIDVHPPFKLPTQVLFALERYKSTYSFAYFMFTLAWAIPYFGVGYLALLTAVVAFAIAYLYVPSGIYHPSIPWYNRYRVWSYMRNKVSGIYPRHMSVLDVIMYAKAFIGEIDHFLLAIVVGEVSIVMKEGFPDYE